MSSASGWKVESSGISPAASHEPRWRWIDSGPPARNWPARPPKARMSCGFMSAIARSAIGRMSRHSMSMGGRLPGGRHGRKLRYETGACAASPRPIAASMRSSSTAFLSAKIFPARSSSDRGRSAMTNTRAPGASSAKHILEAVRRKGWASNRSSTAARSVSEVVARAAAWISSIEASPSAGGREGAGRGVAGVICGFGAARTAMGATTGCGGASAKRLTGSAARASSAPISRSHTSMRAASAGERPAAFGLSLMSQLGACLTSCKSYNRPPSELKLRGPW